MLSGVPVDRQHRRHRLHVVDLEVARARDPLRRETHPQAPLDLEVGALLLGQVARSGAAAQELGLDLRLDQDVARPLLHRLVLLILGVGEADALHLADDHTAVLELRPDVESLHRLVEVGLDRELRLEPAPGTDHDQHDDARDDGAHHEESELEVVGLEAHRASVRRRPVSASRRKNARTRGSVVSSRKRRGSPSAMMPFALRSQQDHAVHGDEHAAEVVRHDHERDAEVLGQPADRRVERRGGDRIETRGGFVEEEDRRVERHGARDARALLHAAGKLRRHVAREAPRARRARASSAR